MSDNVSIIPARLIVTSLTPEPGMTPAVPEFLLRAIAESIKEHSLVTKNLDDWEKQEDYPQSNGEMWITPEGFVIEIERETQEQEDV
jgi:hypothetical protein